MLPVTEFVPVFPVFLSFERKGFYLIRNISLMYKIVLDILRGIIIVIKGWVQSFPLNAHGGVQQDK